jgi:hemoglobin/transferrin/lactoferrin receptor protein
MIVAGHSPALAQAPVALDTITVAASRTEERAIDALAPVSVITLDTINTVNAKRLSDIFYNTPGVTFQERGDNPETSINIRGLQDFGRVAVIVDGARQNYQRSGHNANGGFFLEPELIGGVDIVRGPTANIYGSGAIGGVVSFRTKDADDILKPGERFATTFAGMAGSDSGRFMGSVFTAGKPNENIDYILGATHRLQNNYKGGDGIEIANTANHISTGLAKLTVRPADEHSVQFGGIIQEDLFNIGQYRRSPAATDGGTSVYATDVMNYQTNARWKYYRPDDKLFNWDANIYWNRTENNQTKIAHNAASLGNPISGYIGDPRGYKLDTIGFDANNTSRFETGGFSHALTISGDAFKDDVNTFDSRGNSNITTPSGQRTVMGAFAQLKTTYSNWLEVIGAVRYDKYELESATDSASGDRLSPKITIGVTPVQGFTPYVSYAEGYRAPSITETLIAGAHVSATSQSALFNCPGATGLQLFCFLPNPNLRPEVGKTKEDGLNLKYDNIFKPGDSFRGKINAFRNDLEDYIELTASPPTTVSVQVSAFPPPFGTFVNVTASQFYQYQNIDKAHIQGFEAETMYDAGDWFLGVSATLQSGYNDVTDQGLINIQGNRIVTTGGVRLLDRKLTIGSAWTSVASNQHVPADYVPSTSYDLLNFFLTYEPVKDLWVNFTVDNALNRYYRPYAIPRGSDSSGTQNDVLWASVPPGIVYKGSVRMRFSAM